MGEEFESEISIQELRISGERKRTIAMRRSRVTLEKGMSPEMRDAEREIEQTFRNSAGRLGYGSNDLNRVRGQSELTHEQELRIKKMQTKLVKWTKACPKVYQVIVFDLAVFGTTLTEVCQKRAIQRRTAVNRFHRGLQEYCKANGMYRKYLLPSQKE